MKEVISDLSLLLLKFAKNKQENIAKSSLEYFALLVDQIVINHKSARDDTNQTPTEGQEEPQQIKKDGKNNLVFGIAESKILCRIVIKRCLDQHSYISVYTLVRY